MKRAFDDPGFRRDEKIYRRGAIAFSVHCSNCHGAGAIASGQAPDLRTSDVALSSETFGSVVRDGALLPVGMPRFEELTDQELSDLRHYIRAEAEQLRGQTSSGKR